MVNASHDRVPDPDDDTLSPEQQEKALREEISEIETYLADARERREARKRDLARYPSNVSQPWDRIQMEMDVDGIHHNRTEDLGERLYFARQKLKQLMAHETGSTAA